MNAKLKEIHERINALKAENENPPDGMIVVDFVPILKILADLVEEVQRMEHVNSRALLIHHESIEALQNRTSHL